MNINLPHFGEVILEYDEYISSDPNYIDFPYSYGIGENVGDDFTFNKKPLDLDVNFTDLSESNIKMATNALNHLNEILEKGKQYVIKDFKNPKGVVRSYIDDWIEYYIDEEPFKDLVKKPVTENTPIELLNKLDVVRVGIYAYSKSEPFIIIDFAFGYDINSGYRDEMIVVNLDKNYNLIDISTEG